MNADTLRAQICSVARRIVMTLSFPFGIRNMDEAEEAEFVIGKTIAGVEAEEFGLTLVFSDGSKLQTRGSSYGGSLDVYVEHKP